MRQVSSDAATLRALHVRRLRSAAVAAAAVMFGSSMRFSRSADFMVQLSVTLSDPEPQFQGHSIVQRRISRKRCIRSTPCLLIGKSCTGQAQLTQGIRATAPSFQDGGCSKMVDWSSPAILDIIKPEIAPFDPPTPHFGKTALSRVTLASAGLSCLNSHCTV